MDKRVVRQNLQIEHSLTDKLLMNSRKTAFVWGSAGIAQLVEQLICNQQVVGSNPTAGSLNFGLRIADCGFAKAQPFHRGEGSCS